MRLVFFKSSFNKNTGRSNLIARILQRKPGCNNVTLENRSGGRTGMGCVQSNTQDAQVVAAIIELCAEYLQREGTLSALESRSWGLEKWHVGRIFGNASSGYQKAFHLFSSDLTPQIMQGIKLYKKEVKTRNEPNFSSDTLTQIDCHFIAANLAHHLMKSLLSSNPSELSFRFDEVVKVSDELAFTFPNYDINSIKTFKLKWLVSGRSVSSEDPREKDLLSAKLMDEIIHCIELLNIPRFMHCALAHIAAKRSRQEDAEAALYARMPNADRLKSTPKEYAQ